MGAATVAALLMIGGTGGGNEASRTNRQRVRPQAQPQLDEERHVRPRYMNEPAAENGTTSARFAPSTRADCEADNKPVAYALPTEVGVATMLYGGRPIVCAIPD